MATGIGRMTDLPHFALPFRFDAGAAAVVEQDTTDEIMTCALAVLLCPVGARMELPAFGIPDPTFSEANVDAGVIAAALTTWEPRAQQVVESNPDALDDLVAHVTVRLNTPSDD
jgi:hypothetical protein